MKVILLIFVTTHPLPPLFSEERGNMIFPLSLFA